MIALFALLAAVAVALSVLLATSRAQARELRSSLQAREAELRSERDARAAECAARAATEARAAAVCEAAEEKMALVQGAERRLAETFDALCSRALQANNEQFLQLARESLVRPVHESLDKVDGKIQQIEQARAAAYASLTEQVRSLLETQNALRAETGNLVKALRSPVVRGRWGEMQLQRVVEMAGMLEHCDFAQQETVDGDEGRLRPDLVVKLPGGKQLVVDAKAPLAAYLDALEARSEEERAAHLTAHARQMRNHVTQLARKAYWDQFDHTPEFVVMFVPNEAVFSAAMERDPSLMEGAFSERVLLASPTTLIALLRAAAFGWRQERLANDAQDIAALGRELHKRLGKMAEHLATVGKRLASAVGAYNETVGSFGHMVLPAARKLREKAAPMDEELPPFDEVDVSPRPVQPAETPLALPEDAN
jgi:DNA recombination protein RmuC